MNLVIRVAAFLAATMLSVFAQEPQSLDWSGAHVGVHAGIGSGPLTYLYDTAPPDVVTFDVNGYVAGVQAGYDWQIGRLVFGVSGEVSGSSVGGDFR